MESGCACSSSPCHLATWSASVNASGRMGCSFCARCGGVWGTVCASETARESGEIETPGATASELGLSVWGSVSASGRVGWESVFATATGPLVMGSAMAWPVISGVEPM